jgi:hypothetical protein
MDQAQQKELAVKKPAKKTMAAKKFKGVRRETGTILNDLGLKRIPLEGMRCPKKSSPNKTLNVLRCRKSGLFPAVSM